MITVPGSSATRTFTPVVCEISSARSVSCAWPPTNTIPWALTSWERSGGESARHSCTRRSVAFTVSARAALTSSARTSIVSIWPSSMARALMVRDSP